MPATHLISVDLPAPLSPTRAITSPSRTSKSTPLRASTEPKCFDTSRSSSVGEEALVTRGFVSRCGCPRRGTHTDSVSYLQYCAYVPLQIWARLRKPSVRSSFQFAFVTQIGVSRIDFVPLTWPFTPGT